MYRIGDHVLTRFGGVHERRWTRRGGGRVEQSREPAGETPGRRCPCPNLPPRACTFLSFFHFPLTAKAISSIEVRWLVMLSRPSNGSTAS